MTDDRKEDVDRGDDDPFRESPLDTDAVTRIKRLGALNREVAEEAIRGLKAISKQKSYRACRRSSVASLEAIVCLLQEQQVRLDVERSLVIKP